MIIVVVVTIPIACKCLSQIMTSLWLVFNRWIRNSWSNSINFSVGPREVRRNWPRSRTFTSSVTRKTSGPLRGTTKYILRNARWTIAPDYRRVLVRDSVGTVAVTDWRPYGIPGLEPCRVGSINIVLRSVKLGTRLPQVTAMYLPENVLYSGSM